MVDDASLKKACLLLAFAGMGGLAIAGMMATPLDVSNVNEENLGKIVKMRGAATGVAHSTGTTFLEINGVKIVRFSNAIVKDGDIVEVTGRVSLYRGELEIVADDIRGVGN